MVFAKVFGSLRLVLSGEFIFCACKLVCVMFCVCFMFYSKSYMFYWWGLRFSIKPFKYILIFLVFFL